LGDTNFDNARDASDVTAFETTLYSQNQQFNPGGDLNGDGKIDSVDLFALQAFYSGTGATAGAAAARSAVLRRGDVNGGFSTAANAADITSLYQNLGSTNWNYDLTSSGGAANQADVDTLIRTILHSEYGDANLDGIVNALDFNALAAKFGQVNTGWSGADFDGNGTVGSGDFTLLSQHFGFRYVDPLAGLGTVVPEPICLPIVIATAALIRRRRNSPVSHLNSQG